jgi:hypothetical protein
MRGLPDGSLYDWGEIVSERDWGTLLIGNGLSRHIWEPFGYPKLFDHASASALTEADRALFENTPNFERVLGDLLTAIRVCSATGIDPARLFERYRNIQKALGEAVGAVHINRDAVPGETRQEIRDVMAEYEWVFTTNYDLLLYWAMAYKGKFRPFIDHFRWAGRCEFDPLRSPVYEGEVPIYFLHGALHLVVAGDGRVFKLKRNMETLLDQFGQPVDGDPVARPLLVTEGSSVDKLKAIESNSYLDHALNVLRENAWDTVAFGCGLGPEDAHIADALSERPGKSVAVSMMPDTKAALLAKQTEIHGRVEVDQLLFFDATTHPLGRPELKIS